MRSVRFDTIVVTDVSAKVTGAGSELSARVCFASSKDGRTYATGNYEMWSKETREKFAELVRSMRDDVERYVFTDAGSAVPTQEEGLGERFAEDGDVPSV